MKKSTQLRIFFFSLLFIILIAAAKITQDNRSQADRELKRETALSAERNDQIKSEQRAREDYELEKKQAETNRIYSGY